MSKLRVVVADDHDCMRLALISVLREKFEVVGAVEDGRTLVQAVISLHPDVIVSDVMMPELTGPQAMRELRALGQETPFVFVSTDPQLAGHWALFVSKMDMRRQLVPAVDAAASGKKHI